MEFNYVTLENCAAATGTVIVIDVLRAFTTAAYAFAAGAKDIILVGTVDEALHLQQQMPETLLMGEVDGLPVPGFDFPNSPAAIAGQQLAGRRLIQRTSAGTQGVVRSSQATNLLVSSLVCAEATVGYVKQHNPAAVTFVVTGTIDNRDGDEDRACADYLAARLQGQAPDTALFVERVYRSTVGPKFLEGLPDFPLQDLIRCTEFNRFSFAMKVERQGERLILQKVSPA